MSPVHVISDFFAIFEMPDACVSVKSRLLLRKIWFFTPILHAHRSNMQDSYIPPVYRADFAETQQSSFLYLKFDEYRV